MASQGWRRLRLIWERYPINQETAREDGTECKKSICMLRLQVTAPVLTLGDFLALRRPDSKKPVQDGFFACQSASGCRVSDLALGRLAGFGRLIGIDQQGLALAIDGGLVEHHPGHIAL
ncbi:Uncharacterised protein [Bordetella trematum]|nr:Uncharacterised protein [Bordetella trematum]